MTAIDALDSLRRLTLAKKKLLSKSDKNWSEFLFDVEQLCGWLLLKSLRSDWWFQHKSRLNEFLKNGGSFPFQVNEKGFIEVIISRSVLRQAEFTLDYERSAVPAGDEYDIMMFDAVSDEARKETLLTRLFKDLRGRDAKLPENNLQRALMLIQQVAEGTSRIRNAPLYYLISKETMGLLKKETWFPEAESMLNGYLHFICLEIPEALSTDDATDDDQAKLLEAIAAILRIKDQ